MSKIKKSWRSHFEALKEPMRTAQQIAYEPEEKPIDLDKDCFVCGKLLNDSPVSEIADGMKFKYHPECWELEGKNLDSSIFDVMEGEETDRPRH